MSCVRSRRGAEARRLRKAQRVEQVIEVWQVQAKEVGGEQEVRGVRAAGPVRVRQSRRLCLSTLGETRAPLRALAVARRFCAHSQRDESAFDSAFFSSPSAFWVCILPFSTSVPSLLNCKC